MLRPFLFLLLCLSLPAVAHAQTAAAPTPAAPIVSSPISGIVFEDAPRILPVDSRFSQAIQTIGFDLGLSCSQIESYGWALAPTEQNRVNGIFAAAAQELARLGYAVQPQNPASATADLTVFTATRPDRTVLFTWSAGANGLLLLLCDARTDVASQGFGPAPGTVHRTTNLAEPGAAPPPPPIEPQALVGDWQGTYSCMSQGPAGATLTISRVKRDYSGTAISGSFSFYPLDDRNPDAPRGSYRVAGRLDTDSGRALLDPGQWLQRPPGFTNAPLIAEFTPAARGETPRVSAVFQATTGCTSFEANYKPGSALAAMTKAAPDTMAPIIDDDLPRKAKPVRKARKPVAHTIVKPVPAEAMPAAPAPAPVETTPAVATPAESAPIVVPSKAPATAAPSTPVDAHAPATGETPAPVAPLTTPPPTAATTSAPPAPESPTPGATVVMTTTPTVATIATDKADEKKPLTIEPLPTEAAKPTTPAPVTAAPITVPAAPLAPVQ